MSAKNLNGLAWTPTISLVTTSLFSELIPSYINFEILDFKSEKRLT